MIKVMSVFGTRPEAIKMCPLVKELESRSEIVSVVCVTGQHREMLDSVLEVFNVKPKYDLSIMKQNQSLFDVTTNIMMNIKEVLEIEKPNIVLVHGDTSTTFSTALACFYLGIDIGHVEAGLRTYNMYSPFPEEFNRCATSLISNLNFAPTIKARENLIKEGHNQENIFVTGNTAIDALNTTVNESYSHSIFDWIGDDKLILITAHRRENIGEPMKNMFKAIKRVLDENPGYKAVYPIHMNPKVRLIANEIFESSECVKLIEPLDVVDFHNFMNLSNIIVTDSGGIQEEAPSLGVPVLVMRDTTERPEGIDAGTLKLVGVEEEPIYTALSDLINNKSIYESMAKAANPYGDGTASIQIADILIKKYQ